jgi:NhaP-type Na+/H+ or K+/H+ antiporter
MDPITVLWQRTFGLAIGLVIGKLANKVLRFSDLRWYISQPSFVVFYLLLAILSVGVGSTLGSDDFLVAFGAGVGFAHDGWFSKKTKSLPFPTIIDMVLNSSLFVFFGSIIPWNQFVPPEITPSCGAWQLLLFLVLALLFRRIPIVYAMKRFNPKPENLSRSSVLWAFWANGCGRFVPRRRGTCRVGDGNVEAPRKAKDLGTAVHRDAGGYSSHMAGDLICGVG